MPFVYTQAKHCVKPQQGLNQMTREERALARAALRPAKPTKKAKKELHEIENDAEFETAFYGKHGVTPKDAAKRMGVAEKPSKKSKAKPAKAKEPKAKPEPTEKKPRAKKANPLDATAADLPSIATNMAPTTEVAAQMQEAFDFLNHRLFDGKLPGVVMSWTRLKKAHGYFWPKSWTRKGEGQRSTHEIALDPFRCSLEKDKDVLGTLAHEMVHELDEELGTAPKRAYHTKTWAERMKAIGLYPSTTAAPGGKETGPNCSHYIIEGGLFDKAADDLLAKGFRFTWTTIPEPEKVKGKKSKAGAKAKHTCPSCEANAWGKPSLHLHCGDCDVKMLCPDREEYEGGDEDEGDA